MKARWGVTLPLTLLALMLVIVGQAFAQGGGYTLMRGVTSNGGVTVVEWQSYEFTATLGQPFAGSSATGSTQLAAGYWHGTAVIVPTRSGQELYLPAIRR